MCRKDRQTTENGRLTVLLIYTSFFTAPDGRNACNDVIIPNHTGAGRLQVTIKASARFFADTENLYLPYFYYILRKKGSQPQIDRVVENGNHK